MFSSETLTIHYLLLTTESPSTYKVYLLQLN
jgi:hypothetical protein